MAGQNPHGDIALRPLVLVFYWFCLLAWPFRAPAQDIVDNSPEDLDHIARKFDAPRWMPLRTKEPNHDPGSKAEDLDSLRSLSYLQGYNPPSHYQNVTIYDQRQAYDGYNLLVSAHAPCATLMDMNGRTLHQWCLPTKKLAVDPHYCSNYWVRVRLLKNGDLLAMIDFGGLLKLDKNSHLLWFHNIICHHDMDLSSDGDIYILTADIQTINGNADFKNNNITILSPGGQIKQVLSLHDLFSRYPDQRYIKQIDALAIKRVFNADHGRKTFFVVPGDSFHANSIQILDGRWAWKFPAFQKGNLLITIRSIGVIICVDPRTKKIVWLMDPVLWSKGEHDARLLDNGHILIFDNFYRFNMQGYDSPWNTNLSRVVEFDPASQHIVWDYAQENGPFFSLISGQAYRLPNGNTLITESTNGHSMEVTPAKTIVWEYYNPHQVDKNNDLLPPPLQKRPLGEYQKLVAMVYQMQRIDKNLVSDWLMDQTKAPRQNQKT